ncbi:hypothetical protein P8452_17922 [Trifolium repens]|nr:hypothetical protein P8452_17922 [Trifolium repens]
MEDDTNDSEDSHYIPSDIEAEEAYIEKVVEPKRLRGPTRMQDVWDMDADDIIIVNLDKKGRPTDSRVDLNQWRKLVHHWFSEEGQKISKINRENRAKFKDVHCMGTKSLPKLIDEKKKNSNGRSPTRKEIYIETRTRKDGSIVNENARRVIEKLNKYDNETGTSQSVEEIQSDMPWKDDIYSKVKGTEKRDAVLANVLSLIQNRFVGEDVNEILRAARQVTNASNAPDQTDSPSSYTDED